MMKTVLLGDEVGVVKNGVATQMDPPGSTYCVMDYVNDPFARSAAIAMANAARVREPAYADAMLTSLEGGEEGSPLRVYDVTPQVAVPEDGRYLVLNYSHHYPSRVAMRRYWLKIKDVDSDLAARLDSELRNTEGEFMGYVKSRIPKKKKGKQ